MFLNGFKAKLQIVFPNSKYRDLDFGSASDEKEGELITDILKDFDTGVSKLVLRKVSSFDDIKLPPNFKDQIIEDLKSSKGCCNFRGQEINDIKLNWVKMEK